MGIKDLLRFVKPYIEPINIKKYAGQRVGIDAYSWLHKGAYSCSMELCLNSDGDKKLQYLKYFMHRINLLRHYEITPVVVLDGGDLPSKSATHDGRERKRQANCDLAMEKLKEGDTAGASELFQRGVSITPSMARQLIQILKAENIEYVVAPYEADAQLAFLSTIEAGKGGIVAVISEDSDLLAYGCPSVIFKMDKYGKGEEINLDRVFDSPEVKPSFRNFDKLLFTGMCVLAGCDFLPSIPGIGIVKAHGLVSKYRNLDRVVSVLKFDKGSLVPDDYSRSFKEAVAVFHHARVYDASLKQLKHLKPIPEALLQSIDENLDFLGPDIAPAFATAIARGDINPCTMEAFDLNPSQGSCTNLNKVTNITHWQVKEPTSLPSKEGCISIVSSKCREGVSLTEQKVGSAGKNKHINKELEVEKLILTFKDDFPAENKANAKKVGSAGKNKHVNKELEVEKLILNFKDDTPAENRANAKKVGSAGKNKHINKELEVEKLILTFKDDTPAENRAKSNKKSPRVTNNNPFKKAKQVHSPEMTDSVTEDVSVVTEVESPEIISISPDSQKSVEFEPEIISISPDSQKSVESEPEIIHFDNTKLGNGKKGKRSSRCESLQSDKRTIFSFFSRV